MTTREAVIVDAVRTPVGRYAGALKDVRPDDLAALVIQALVRRNNLDPASIDRTVRARTDADEGIYRLDEGALRALRRVAAK